MLPTERIRDDLLGLIRGELLFDEVSLNLYGTDASIFELRPAGVVVPRDAEDVQALVRYAQENQVPLTPRGAGTGVAGGALGPGIIVDFSTHFRGILEVGEDSVRVEPGVVLRDLNDRLAPLGRRLAVDPVNVECTLGGMIATNTCGTRAVRHGYVRDHVRSLEVVLDNGDRVTARRHFPTPFPADRLGQVVSSLSRLLDRNRTRIPLVRPRTRFDRCGYQLYDLLEGEALDLARLMTGSEGTLGLIVEAELGTIPLPGGRAVALFGFDSLEAALHAGRLAGQAPELSACQLIERRLLRLVREEDPRVARLIPPVEAVLLVEMEGDTPDRARRAAEDVERHVRAERRLDFSMLAFHEAEINSLWGICHAVLPSLYALRSRAQPVAFLEDVAVPLGELPGYLHAVQEILQRHEITAAYLIDAATGQVHMRPFLDLSRRDEVARMWHLADDVYAVVAERGGTISTRHAVGLARTPWISQQFGPLLPLLAEVKHIFDPQGILNPGKIVRQVRGGGSSAPGHDLATMLQRAGTDDASSSPPSLPSSPPIWPLRRALGDRAEDLAADLPASPPSRLLRWRPREAEMEIASCNGCGVCRTESQVQRMCPMFRVHHSEVATPRAKANLMRVLLHADDPARALPPALIREAADLCVNCKMCARECPAHVNIPKLMLEAKAAHAAAHGLDRADWVMARTEGFARLGSALAPLTNALLGSRVVRWLLEKLLGVSRRRRLPAFAWRSFLRIARRRGWTEKPAGKVGTGPAPGLRPGQRRIAYFVDVFANYNDPLLGQSVVEVLHHHGIVVYDPPEQHGRGKAPLACGDVETARETVQANLRVLGDLVREGFTILCSEPTAALMLTRDSLDLVDDPDAHLVAANTVELTAFLWELHEQGRLKPVGDLGTPEAPFNGSQSAIHIGHHVPCHLKALGQPPRGPALLELIPGVRVHTIDVSCSGMAGTFGLRSSGHAASLEAGQPMLRELARPRLTFGSTECSTCRLQMEEGAQKRTLHPVQYLALAYGLVPALRERLRQPLGDLLLE